MSDTKNILATIGIDHAWLFCEQNKIPQPKMNISRDLNDPLSERIRSFATCGYYRSGEIFVSVPLCAHQSPMYSWAGFIADRTPYGVIQHELGHHVDEWKTGRNLYRTARGNNFSDMIREKSGEKAITSYSPNSMEWFAEIFRLFATNPALLQKIRPLAYKAIVESGIEPIVGESEIEILKMFEAHPRIYERMNKWIETKK